MLYGDPGAGGEDRPARGEDGEVGGGSEPGERGGAQTGDSAGQESRSSLLAGDVVLLRSSQHRGGGRQPGQPVVQGLQQGALHTNTVINTLYRHYIIISTLGIYQHCEVN